ncbi:hypothetical protein H9P43_004180 [Blastocladiella emersonii ATCC 22665]|nr:hypothetical protein H9P43_004180 [Blastocladiella emersonii ATCC 22665]
MATRTPDNMYSPPSSPAAEAELRTLDLLSNDALAAAAASSSSATPAPPMITGISIDAAAGSTSPSQVSLLPEPEHPWLSSGLTHRLSSSKKSPEELARLRKEGASARVARFYEDQNEMIDEYLAPINAGEDNDDDAKVTLAVRASLGVNVLLLICQIAAATSSGSMSLLATATDSFMDLVSGGILLLADRAAKRQNILDYPTGKKRFETIGVIVFACLMATVAIQIVIEAIRGLAAGQEDGTVVDLKEILLISAALAAKVCLFLYCNSLRQYNTAATLATDHRNDLVLNSFGLTMSLLGVKLLWWLDPVGGIGIGLLILRSWAETAWENIQLIIGRSAPPAFLNKITYLAATHHPSVLQVDTCKAYWLGNNMFVEVDIVLPPDMTLRESHDIGEALQMKLESLPNVERAFVHVDYEFDHSPEHRPKQ